MLRKKRGIKNLFTVLCATFLLWNCENENYQEQIIEDNSSIKTVSNSEVLNYFNQKSFSKKTSNSFLKNVHTDKIKYEKLTNTTELIAVVDAETSFTDKYSRVLLLKINNEVKSVVFSMYPNENKGNDELFSGEIVIKDLKGNFLKGLRVEHGIIKSILYSKHSKSIYSKMSSRNLENCRENCGHSATNLSCICNEQYLDEVEINSTPKTDYVSISTIYGDDGGDELYPGYTWPFSGGGGTSSTDGSNDTNDGCPKDMERSTTGECVCKQGLTMNTNGFCVKKPCPGDPIENVEIVKPGASGLKGGTFGCTRFNSTKTCGGVKGKKKHDGMDIKAEVNTPTFSMYDGEVSSIRNSFSAGQYLYGSYGNYIVIKSVINNNTVFMKYNHLNEVLVKVGDKVKAGQIIGMNGNTGNAAAKGVTPHIHLQVYNASWTSINPIDFLKTKFDSNFQPIESTDCN